MQALRSILSIDRQLDRVHRTTVFSLAVLGVVVVGAADYATGYEISMAVFYLLPVALASWYCGRWPGCAISTMSCISWYCADIADGHPYSHPAIPAWNAVVRLGFFLITAMLVGLLRESYLNQRHLARTDGLTELFSRRVFEDRLGHDLALALRRKTELTLAYVDLDDFKSVNDTFGHAQGDQVLRATGRVLRESSRETDTVARLGGDEFALILPDTDERGARQVITHLFERLAKTFADESLDITCSIGVVTLRDPTMATEQAIAAADALMYEAKGGGKGRVLFRVLGPQEQATGEGSESR